MPSEYKPPEYKPPKMCLKISISPGLYSGFYGVWNFGAFSSISQWVCNIFYQISLMARSLIANVLVALGTRFKVPILAVFERLLTFLKLPILAQAFNLEQSFFTKNEFNLCTFTCSKRFLMALSPVLKIKIMQTKFVKSRCPFLAL